MAHLLGSQMFLNVKKKQIGEQPSIFLGRKYVCLILSYFRRSFSDYRINAGYSFWT